MFYFLCFIYLFKFIYFNWKLITLQYCIGFWQSLKHSQVFENCQGHIFKLLFAHGICVLTS